MMSKRLICTNWPECRWHGFDVEVCPECGGEVCLWENTSVPLNINYGLNAGYVVPKDFKKGIYTATRTGEENTILTRHSNVRLYNDDERERNE